MAKRVLLCLSHSIEEYDMLRLLHGLGYEVASIGGYIDPANPHDPKRPALDIPCYPEVKDAVDGLGTDDNFGSAQSRIPEPILEWLGSDGIIIFHHYLSRLFGQWEHLADWRSGGGRVIWRTVGQSVEGNERAAQPYREDGLEIVRYSPRERFIPGYAGEDTIIRFYKDEMEWCGWNGWRPLCINITQDLARRAVHCNYEFWREATRSVPAIPLGPGSELIGGPGQMSLDAMKSALQSARCYLYTGTQPASYTLGLLEALMTGIPVVSIGSGHMTMFPYGPDLFEAPDLCEFSTDDSEDARSILTHLLLDKEAAVQISKRQRRRAIAEFGREAVGQAWAALLG